MSYERPFRQSPEKSRRKSGAVAKNNHIPLKEIKLPYTALLIKEGGYYSGAASILYEGNQSEVLHWRSVLFDASKPRKIIFPIDLLTDEKAVLGYTQIECDDGFGEIQLKSPDFSKETQRRLDIILTSLIQKIQNSELEEKTITSPIKGYIRKYFGKDYLKRINANGKKFYRIIDELILPANTKL